MKQLFVSKVFVSTLLLASPVTMQAQNAWAMATVEDGKSLPTFSQFNCEQETGANGIEYLRIYDWGFFIRGEYYNPVKLKYGYRMSDKKIFVYDFEADEERLAFDFTLAAGDHFSTYNGMEWGIDAAIDTLVNISYQGKGESTTKRLLKVHSADGRYSDQWLEDFGSFTNHFMILPMSDTGQTHTLWMEYDFGCYLVREISSDPFFTYDSGTPENNHGNPDEESSGFNCTYNNGTLTIDYFGWQSPNRQYNCYYREGDDFYRTFLWELDPATGAAYVVRHKYTAYFYGLPAPQGGEYKMHFNRPDPSSDTENLTNVSCNKQTDSPIFDLQGRKQASSPKEGIYIQEGRKRVVK